MLGLLHSFFLTKNCTVIRKSPIEAAAEVVRNMEPFSASQRSLTIGFSKTNMAVTSKFAISGPPNMMFNNFRQDT